MEDPVRYPRNVLVNFRKLDKIALMKLLNHYGVTLSPQQQKNIQQSEMAAMVARLFDQSTVAEFEVVRRFADDFCYAGAEQHPSNSKKRTASTREALDREPAVPGEQVAAKITKEYEDGGWILANVLDYDPRSQTYEVQDEDDINRVMTLPFGDVRRLEDTCAHLRRGDAVLAVFPETTSFYPALVAKNPKSPTGSNNSNGWEVVVRFEDDEDEAGKIAARRVPARFVLRRADVEEMNDESDDED